MVPDQPGGFFDIKARSAVSLEASDGIFQSGVFAGDKRLSQAFTFIVRKARNDTGFA
ncbi:MAG: hypothetical protein ACLTXH_02545 [Enterobacter hormaechei]